MGKVEPRELCNKLIKESKTGRRCVRLKNHAGPCM